MWPRERKHSLKRPHEESGISLLGVNVLRPLGILETLNELKSEVVPSKLAPAVLCQPCVVCRILDIVSRRVSGMQCGDFLLCWPWW